MTTYCHTILILLTQLSLVADGWLKLSSFTMIYNEKYYDNREHSLHGTYGIQNWHRVGGCSIENQSGEIVSCIFRMIQ